MSLGFAPELGQQTMTEELLALLQEMLGSGPTRSRNWRISAMRAIRKNVLHQTPVPHATPGDEDASEVAAVVDYYHAASR